jgi:hypothetical protein
MPKRKDWTAQRFGRAPAVRDWKMCRMHGARGGAPKGKRNGNYRHGGRTMKMIEVWKLIKSLRLRPLGEADKDRKFIIEPHFAGRKSLM